MTVFHAPKVLTEIVNHQCVWLDDCYIRTDSHGDIVTISQQKPKSSTSITKLSGALIPGIVNAHSHAFQYAMAGMAEYLPLDSKGDDFWSWRQRMYHLALQLSAEQMYQIATAAYVAMLAAGYTHVVEFHYLHHDQDGSPYRKCSEMSSALIDAAEQAGIGITLVPVFYHYGDFGKSASSHQRRFISRTVDDFLKIVTEVEGKIAKTRNAQLGLSIHSLRAADKQQITEVLANCRNQPFHIHVAEQPKEVEACKVHYGKTPVKWLLDNFDVDRRWNLIHATHMTNDELAQLAATQARVVLCPSTEANLADGLFSYVDYRRLGGRSAIGSDSHVDLDPFFELKLLDYGQRLFLQRRNIVCMEPGQHSAVEMFNDMWQQGHAAAGTVRSQFFQQGKPFDALVIDHKSPLLQRSGANTLMGTLVYHGGKSMIQATIKSGKTVVSRGRHFQQAAVAKDVRAVLRYLYSTN